MDSDRVGVCRPLEQVSKKSLLSQALRLSDLFNPGKECSLWQVRGLPAGKRVLSWGLLIVAVAWTLPGTFLNALRQQTSRTLSCPMDQLKMVSAWDSAKLKHTAMSVTIEGLLLQVSGVDFPGLGEGSTSPVFNMSAV